FSAPAPVIQTENFWSRLHPSVTQVARDRFNASHYADAVEAAFKELNTKVKAYMKRATVRSSMEPISCSAHSRRTGQLSAWPIFLRKTDGTSSKATCRCLRVP